MRDIHTTIVSKHLAARDNNKIFRTHPPQVSSTEENLLRHTRRTLAQLRTNKSPFLLSYLHKIDASTHPSPLCPLCRTHEHTTQHLFSCPQIHTTLSALDLWRDPSGVAALLDDWREKLAANPHKATETNSLPISREEWVDNNNTSRTTTIGIFRKKTTENSFLNLETFDIASEPLAGDGEGEGLNDFDDTKIMRGQTRTKPSGGIVKRNAMRGNAADAYKRVGMGEKE